MSSRAAVSRLDQAASDKAYDRWAPVYDLVFELPFRPGRNAAAAAVSASAGPEGEILVAGVGTGLELGLLPQQSRVIGIDVSRPMLDHARRRVARWQLDHVRALLEMDAGALGFGENSFDAVLAPFVLSVVPDPGRVLDELYRVVRPGGEIAIVNHYGAEKGWRVPVETAMDSAAAWLGWNPRFPFAATGDWLKANPQAQLLERRELPPLQLFTLIRIGKPGK